MINLKTNYFKNLVNDYASFLHKIILNKNCVYKWTNFK